MLSRLHIIVLNVKMLSVNVLLLSSRGEKNGPENQL